MRLTFILCALASVFISSGTALAKPAGCPCSPCKCSPCTCGGGSKDGKHHGKDKERGHGAVGVGGTVDLGGVGQRQGEPNPFAGDSTGKARVSYVDRDLPKAFKNLPKGYKIVHGRGGKGFYAEWDGLRPGRPINWDDKHGVWMPPGFVPESGDADHAHNPTSGENAHWDEKTKQWTSSKTGKPIGYQQ